MPTLPWIATGATDPGADPATAEAFVMASRFRLRRFRDVPRFFLDAMRVHAQVRKADGALGVSLVAHPLRREFWTLSAWRDRAALEAMAGSGPHRTIMTRYRGATAEARFSFWSTPAAALPVSWERAREQLAAAS